MFQSCSLEVFRLLIVLRSRRPTSKMAAWISRNLAALGGLIGSDCTKELLHNHCIKVRILNCPVQYNIWRITIFLFYLFIYLFYFLVCLFVLTCVTPTLRSSCISMLWSNDGANKPDWVSVP